MMGYVHRYELSRKAVPLHFELLDAQSLGRVYIITGEHDYRRASVLPMVSIQAPMISIDNRDDPCCVYAMKSHSPKTTLMIRAVCMQMKSQGKAPLALRWERLKHRHQVRSHTGGFSWRLCRDAHPSLPLFALGLSWPHGGGGDGDSGRRGYHDGWVEASPWWWCVCLRTRSRRGTNVVWVETSP
jgi:hypothetical protein